MSSDHDNVYRIFLSILIPSSSSSSCLPHRSSHSAGASIRPSAPSCTAITGGVWNGTQQQDAYIIKWTRVQMKLLSHPIKVNYQRQNAAARKRERERGPCIALMNNIISGNGEETPSCTYQRKTERGERERDGTQHWLPNYAFYHFSHNRVPPFLSCPVYSCSCSSAALMRKIKNNHNRVIFTCTGRQITSCCSITQPPHHVKVPQSLSDHILRKQ